MFGKATSLTLLAAGAAATAVAGCGSSGKAHTTAAQQPAAATTTTAKSTPPYHPKIVPADFSSHVTNPYFSLKPGMRRVYDGTKDGVPEHVVVTVSRATRKITGVDCVIVNDVVTVNNALEENTTDWYAQDKQGNVWYFGEDSKDYKNGVVVSTQGTWEAGVDGALPGVVIHAKPAVGPTYRQEYRPGVAEDMAKVLTVTATQKVKAGTFHNTVLTLDTDPLNPDKVEHKWYARGVGMIHAIRIGGQHREEIKLVQATG
jgi:NAD(P)-dependent dehydrogenase (short-subunit alcohol dehydrogenase family)